MKTGSLGVGMSTSATVVVDQAKKENELTLSCLCLLRPGTLSPSNNLQNTENAPIMRLSKGLMDMGNDGSDWGGGQGNRAVVWGKPIYGSAILSLLQPIWSICDIKV